MNNNDRLDKMQIEVQNNSKQLEKIIVNELPHIRGQLSTILGKLSILKPLVVSLSVGVFLAILGIALKLAGVY